MAICHAKAVRKMKHYLRTGFGISKEHIKWNEECNPGGLGKGHGGASVSWHSHMIILEKEYEKETGHNVTYDNPDNT